MMPINSIDINCDLGESFGAYSLGPDSEVMKYISSANIACGWHAGDSVVMGNTVELAAVYGVSIGAHPGYPDLVGFGRRHMECSPSEIKSYVTYQIGALNAFCVSHSVELRHVKPHGALYSKAMIDENVAHSICEALANLNNKLSLFALAGQKGDQLEKIASGYGLRVFREAFPDRQYLPDGALVPRSHPEATLTDPQEVMDRALAMVIDSKVHTINGSAVEIEVHTLCVHGDNQSALSIVKLLRNGLEKEGLRIQAPHLSIN